VCGSARGTWLWLREQQLKWPLQPAAGAVSPALQVMWVEPTYHAVHTTPTHPAYAGAYVYGRTRADRYVTAEGDLKSRRRRIGRDEWEVFIPEHHQGFLDWATFLSNQERLGRNIRPVAHHPGTGAVREGCALLQGLALCGVCGRKLAVYYDGRHHNTPGYYCTGTGHLVDGKQLRHLRIGGLGIDAAVGQAFLAALAGDAPAACLAAARQLSDGHDSALEQYRRQVQQARYDATRAERRYLAVDAENRLVARGLETAWERALTGLAAAEAELGRRERQAPKPPTPQQQSQILQLGDNLDVVFSAPSTTDRDRKELLGTLLTDVTISVDRAAGHADLVLRWKGGAVTELTVPLIARPQDRLRTNEDTIDLVRATGRALPRRPDRRHPEPAEAFHRNRAAVHRRPSAEPSPSLEHRLPPTTIRRRGRRPGPDHRPGRRTTSTPCTDPAPVDHRRIPRRRATHPRCARPDPPHRADPGPVRRPSPRRVACDARSHPRPPTDPRNDHEEHQNRRTTGCLRPYRPTKRTPNRTTETTTHAVRGITIRKEAV